MNTSQSNEKIDRTHLHQPQDHAQTGCWCQERSVFLRSCNAVISKFKSWHGCCLMAKVMNKTVSAKKETLCINPQLTPGSFCERCARNTKQHRVGLLRKVGTKALIPNKKATSSSSSVAFNEGLISCGVFGFLLLRHAPKGSCL